jgi:ADP-ribose pyrophosphatase
MKETIIHKGFVNLVKKDKWEIVRTKGACAVIFYDEHDTIWLVKQFRPAINKYILEVPAETYDKSKKLKPIDYAYNALREELGIIVENKSYITQVSSFYTSPGYTDEKIDLFIFRGFKNSRLNYKIAKQKLDKDEKINIEKIYIMDYHTISKIEDLKTRYLISILNITL